MIGWPEALLLVRHGESTGNVARADAYAAGRAALDIQVNDPSVTLTDLGRRQARALGLRLRSLPPEHRPTAVVCSPYVRARQTTDEVLDAADLTDLAVRVDERLRDRELGVLDRLTWRGVQEQFPQEAERRRYLGKFWHRPPGGESWADVAQRVRAALLELRLDYAGERVLVVAHDVPLLMFRYVLDPLSVEEVIALSGELGNCSLTTYVGVDGGLVLERFDEPAPVEEAGVQETRHE